ncbi:MULTISPECIES: AAA family ATPase [Hydrocarboniphaga]|uniref:AAA family ATPase n=1 Tax=Hydrocarboniphaga TaxID=243627 RepID=UPI000685514F|nr:MULTISPECIES: AAA family ATPase [Hydrocarboniphaga]MDZ4077909.1 AAA family ATPase [Hydrocarboniphaga sp.]
MKIASVRVENFRSFRDETIYLNSYSCFVGPNGAGKSNVLGALNVFFREQGNSPTDVTKLTEEDFFHRDTTIPIEITVTFTDLNDEARDALKDYVRQGSLTVKATAAFDSETGVAQVKHFGQRLGMEAFRRYFETEKAGAKAADLAGIYNQLRESHPELTAERSGPARIEALRAFEAANPERCTLIPSEDQFYGSNSTGKLARFIQWVYVPAVKDATDEGLEGRNTALGRLIARAVRSKTNFDSQIEELRKATLESYKKLLTANQEGLTEIGEALQRRLGSWAHPNVRLGIEWLSDPAKSVVLQQPVAGIKTGEGDFLGSLARMGHGLQRSYLLALLQELAAADDATAPTLILGCEEPELYQGFYPVSTDGLERAENF